MPFTFSHPAIILPLQALPKRWISLTGLVIGSVTPDFEYFFRMEMRGNYGHTIAGVFWFDLPLGFILAYCFHVFVKKALILNLPNFLRKRLIFFNDFDWHTYFLNNKFVVIISLLIGTFSHIFWDAFTHHDGYFVLLFPILKHNFTFLNTTIPIYHFLQHLSGLIGGLILVLAILKLPLKQINQAKINYKYWKTFFILVLFITLIRFFKGFQIHQIMDLIATLFGAMTISLIITPKLIYKK
jgi:hypothetical protein